MYICNSPFQVNLLGILFSSNKRHLQFWRFSVFDQHNIHVLHNSFQMLLPLFTEQKGRDTERIQLTFTVSVKVTGLYRVSRYRQGPSERNLQYISNTYPEATPYKPLFSLSIAAAK